MKHDRKTWDQWLALAVAFAAFLFAIFQLVSCSVESKVGDTHERVIAAEGSAHLSIRDAETVPEGEVWWEWGRDVQNWPWCRVVFPRISDGEPRALRVEYDWRFEGHP